MKIIKKISENEMVTAFLRAEINSKRWQKNILSFLQADKVNRNIVDSPNVMDVDENKYRKSLLGKVRGYGQNSMLFENFPSDILWYEVKLSRSDLEKLQYIDYDYWNELSKGTHLVVQGAESVKEGIEIFDQSNEQFWAVADKIANKVAMEPPIIVTPPALDKLVVMEGHLRMTSYFLVAKDKALQELTCILGISEGLKNTSFY